MDQRTTLKATGTVVGVAAFVTAGLVLFSGANRENRQPLPEKVAPLDPAVVAPADQLGRAFAAVAAHVMPAVVGVSSQKHITIGQPEFPFPFGDDFFRQFFGNHAQGIPHEHQFRGQERGLGSGMILDHAGHILTNYHVVRDVDEISVELADKRKFEAVIVGTDPQTDVAVVRIKGSVPADLATVELGDSDAMQVGNMVEAVGAPFGLLQTVTQGIISATGRSDVGIADYEDFLQTDAAINPGNSGGPLVNMHGEVIGMNSAIATSMGQFAGVGFAIPSAMIKQMLPRLIRGEKIVRGQLGVLIQDMTKTLAKQFGLSEAKGVLVSQVNKGSPAEKAGIRPGDVIIRYGGKDLANVRQLRNMVANTPPDSKATLSLVRNGKEQSMSVTIGVQAGGEPEASGPRSTDQLTKLGLTVQNLTPKAAKGLGLDVQEGVLITDVAEGSPASLTGLQKGDVIVEADRKHIANVGDLAQVLDKTKASGQILLRIVRQGGSLFVVISY
ncbi:MAG: Do family serine endopeptidase [Polyangia bacterium]|jgi:serine protease Do